MTFPVRRAGGERSKRRHSSRAHDECLPSNDFTLRDNRTAVHWIQFKTRQRTQRKIILTTTIIDNENSGS